MLRPSLFQLIPSFPLPVLRHTYSQIVRLRKALASSREFGHTNEAERLQGKEAAKQFDAQLAGLRQR
jgi:hypothetical protein